MSIYLQAVQSRAAELGYRVTASDDGVVRYVFPYDVDSHAQEIFRISVTDGDVKWVAQTKAYGFLSSEDLDAIIKIYSNAKQMIDLLNSF